MSYSWDHEVESYRTYLSRKSYLGEITGAMGRAASEIQGSIDAQTRSVIGSNDALASALSGDIAALSSDISAGLSQVTAAFNWGFSELLASMGGMGDSIKELVRIAKTPAQTAAFEHFEIARDSFRKGLIEECLEELGKAIDGDHVSSGYKTEWRFHQLRGIVRLGSFKNPDAAVVDPAKAEESFVLAARYARADAPREAARALLSAGFAAYAQSHEQRDKLKVALSHTEAALSLDPALSEAMFQASKLHMALGAPPAALPVLRKAIEADAAYVVRAAEDPEHQRHAAKVRAFFEAVRAEKHAAVTAKAKAALKEHARAIERCEAVARLEATRRLHRVATAADTGLLDLLTYEQRHLPRDGAALTAEVAAARLRRRVEFRRELVPERATETVKQKVPVEETYYEDVVVDPGGWFRKKQVRSEERTRTRWEMRQVTREVVREVEKVCQVVVDDLGDPVSGVHPQAVVRIPAGTFTMGEGSDAHQVTLTRPLELGVAPVTQALYEAVMGNNPSRFKGPDRPVEQVTWFEAVAFCNAMSKAAGLREAYQVRGEAVTWDRTSPGYRLPTEAEWEYACRAGTTGERYGDVDRVAWYDKYSGGETHPVGAKEPNPWGLYDMLGNVWEWCWDWYGSYPKGAATDPLGDESGSYRVDRGGSWRDGAGCARAANRNCTSPGTRSVYLGFRLSRLAP